eukprot:Hpha_TRINITY_DN30792_c0_g1::TRINITY_DN30792_c0_g1_i1::g.28384::m.28384
MVKDLLLKGIELRNAFEAAKKVHDVGHEELAAKAQQFEAQYLAGGTEGLIAALRVQREVFLWAAELSAHPLAESRIVGNPQGEGFAGEYAAWACRFASQLRATVEACGVPHSATLDACASEEERLRRKWACAVPSGEALDTLASLAPLVECGAGSGLWAKELRARGADIIACDTSHNWRRELNPQARDGVAYEPMTELVEKGPEGLAEYGDRTLVLMWPDQAGTGRFATECLRNYSGSTLALVGEWKGNSFGDCREGLAPSGQSFSDTFQREVEAAFELQKTVELPGWPLLLPRLMVWRRRVEAIPRSWRLLETQQEGRQLVAAAPLRAGSVIIEDAALVHISVSLAPATHPSKQVPKHLLVYDAVREQGRLHELLCSGLQTRGGTALPSEVRAELTVLPEFGLGGVRAAEVGCIGACAGALHYNGFGGQTAEYGGDRLELRSFADISMCNHSCVPSAVVAPRDGLLWNVVDLEQGAPITISYLDDDALLLPKPQRRSRLQSRWGFKCGCERCGDEADDVRSFRAVLPAGELREEAGVRRGSEG